MNDIQTVIHTVLREIQERNSYPLKEITDETMVVKHLGFSSLDVAELIAVLEMKLNVDPFSQGVSIMSIHTVGELCKLYEGSLQQATV